VFGAAEDSEEVALMSIPKWEGAGEEGHLKKLSKGQWTCQGGEATWESFVGFCPGGEKTG